MELTTILIAAIFGICIVGGIFITTLVESTRYLGAKIANLEEIARIDMQVEQLNKEMKEE